MDRFGKQEFRELLQVSSIPAISIYMPIERQEMTNKSLRLQLRARVDEAAERLETAESLEPEDYESLIERLNDLVESRDFWNQTGDGVAIFMAPEYEGIYFLPLNFEARTVVGSNFHTRPLLEHIAAPTDYWVLAIGEKEVSFWEGSPTGVEKVELESLPKNMQDALMLEQEPDQDGLSFRSGTKFNQASTVTQSGSRGARQIPSPMFHGHGGGKEEHNAYLGRYFMEVSRGIQEYLGNAEGPVILAAVDYCHPIFKGSAKLRNLADEGIEGNVHFWNDQQIYEAAWPIAKRQNQSRVDECLEMWERAFGRGSAEMDPATVGRRVVESRVHALLLDEDAEMLGQYDRNTGEVHPLTTDATDEERALASDVYDEIAETVVQLGGDVVVVPSEQMPAQTGIGAILRGNG